MKYSLGVWLASLSITLGCLCSSSTVVAQTPYQKLLDTLTSPVFWGRGYVNDGLHRTTHYLSNYLTQQSFYPLSNADFSQHFSYPINYFPNHCSLSFNETSLKVGIDFILSGVSKGVTGTLQPRAITDSILIDTVQRTIIYLTNTLTATVSSEVNDYTILYVLKKSFPKQHDSGYIDCKNRYEPSFRTANLIASTQVLKPDDSVIVLTAHYDHLGGIGNDIYFPGANDNASGVAMVLSLANYFKKNPIQYPIVVMLFAGEEVGLLGSAFYTAHPLFDMGRIKFLINVDIIGTGDEGVTVVNGTILESAFKRLKAINEEGHYVSFVGSRGKAKNSDHYWFTEHNVPAFFIYSMGKQTAYHNVYDTAESLPYGLSENIYNLLKQFVKGL